MGMSKVPSSTDISGEGSGSITDSCLGFIMYESTYKRFGLTGGNDRKAVSNPMGYDTLGFTPAEDTYYYVELKRTSDSEAIFTVRTGSHEGTIVQSKTNTGNLAGASDLQYLGFYMMKDNASGGAFVTEVDQITIHNAVTSVTPATWTIESPPTAGLKLWLDASDSTTITKDGSNLVSAWNDKSGQLNHVTQATATNQPLWVDAVYNSLPTIRFDGVDNYIFRNTWTGGALTQPNTIFIVCEVPTGSSTKFIYDSLHTGGRNAFFSRGASSVYSVYAGAAPNFGTRNTAFAQFMLEFNGSSTFVRRNKTSIGSSLVAGSLDMSGIYLASNGAATVGEFGDIDISEVLVYTGQLSTTDRDDIEQYLTAKWGL